MSKFAAWVTVSEKGVTELKGGKGLQINAWEGHSKKDRETGEWEKDGSTSYFLTVFDEDLQEIAGELSKGDKIFVAGFYRQKEIKDGETSKWVNNYTVHMIFTTEEDYNDSLADIHEYLAPPRKIEEEKKPVVKKKSTRR